MRVAAFLLGAALLVSLPAAARAQSIRFVGIDGMTQSVKAEGQSSVAGLALRTRIESDDLPLGVTLMPSIEYWRDLDRLDDFGLRASQSDLSFSVDGRYDFGGSTFAPYIGAGLGLHFIDQEFQAPQLGVPRTGEDHTKLGPEALVGVQMAPAGWLQSFMELKYAAVPSFSQFKLNFGLGVLF